jgi:hypothetical protein
MLPRTIRDGRSRTGARRTQQIQQFIEHRSLDELLNNLGCPWRCAPIPVASLTMPA